MGIMGAVGAGLAEAGGAVADIGLAKVKSAIEEDRTARLAELQSEIRMREDATMRQRKVADATDERSRMAAYSAPSVTQSNPDTADAAGLMSADSVGADENVGVDVQRRERVPTLRESQDRARAAGDLSAMGLMGVEANRSEDNARNDKQQVAQENRWKAEDDKWHKTTEETIRHNKALEAKTPAERLSPAAKVQLEIASVGVASAQRAEAEAAKALNEARKSNMPDQITAAEADYKSAKGAVRSALTTYNKTGEAHLGDGWKTLEPEEAKATATPLSVKTGDVLDGYRFRGGDPKVKSNWDRVKDNPTTPEKPASPAIEYPETPGEKWAREKRVRDEARVASKMEEEKKKAASK